MIYLDYAATTPLLPEALEAMQEVLANTFGNPSSMHQAGRQARNVLTEARESIAASLGASPREIYFTSGATEANNWILSTAAGGGLGVGLAGAAAAGGTEDVPAEGATKTTIITSAIEHPSILVAAGALAKEGVNIVYLKPNREGVIDPAHVEAALTPGTALVSIQWVNNEIGTIQDIAAIGRICRAAKVPFHTDAVQAIAHLPFVWRDLPVDYLSLSAHKFGGPKGTGILLAKKAPDSFIHGGRQERGRRAGTENLAGIAGMAAALAHHVRGFAAGSAGDAGEVGDVGEAGGVGGVGGVGVVGEAGEVPETIESRETKLAQNSAAFLRFLSEQGLTFRVHGSDTHRLPGILNIYFPGIDGQTLLLLLDQAGVCVSLGSACEAGSAEPSHVLLALGFSPEEASSSIRFSFNADTPLADLAKAAHHTSAAINKLRR